MLTPRAELPVPAPGMVTPKVDQAPPASTIRGLGESRISTTGLELPPPKLGELPGGSLGGTAIRTSLEFDKAKLPGAGPVVSQKPSASELDAAPITGLKLDLSDQPQEETPAPVLNLPPSAPTPEDSSLADSILVPPSGDRPAAPQRLATQSFSNGPVPQLAPISEMPRERKVADGVARLKKPIGAGLPKLPSKKMLMAGGVAAVVVVIGTSVALVAFRGAAPTLDVKLTSKERAEIADDNYTSYVKLGNRLLNEAQANPKNIGRATAAAEVLAIGVAAHRADAQIMADVSRVLGNIPKTDPPDPGLVRGMAAIALAQGKASDAENQLLPQASHADPATLLLYGWSQLKNHHYKGAETSFKKVIEADPKLASADYGIALCRDASGDAVSRDSWLSRTLESSKSHFAAGLALAHEKGEDAISALIQASGTRASGAELADAWAVVGARQLESGRLEEAEASLRRALDSDRNSTPALIALARVYYELGRYSEASEKLDAVRRNDPNNLEALIGFGRTQLALGQPFLVQEAVQTAVRLAPKDARVKWLQGRAEESMEKEGAQDRAAALYKQAIDLDPKLVEAYDALAQLALKNSHPDQAEALAAEASKAAPDTVEAQTLKGTVLLATSHPDKAQEEFQAALARVPHYLPAQLQLAAALEAQKKPDAALAELEKIRVKAPRYPGLSQRLGSLYQALGRVDDAAKAYEAALKVSGATIQLKFSAATFFYSIKKCERASELAEQITNEDPRNSDAFELLARISECSGKLEQALLNIKHAIDVSDKPQYHLTFAKMLEKLDKGQDALSEYEMAANRGHLPDAYIGRARLNLHHGQNREALRDLDLALRLDKGRADAIALEGRAYMNLLQYHDAESKLQQATNMMPKDPENHYWLAEACAGAKDYTCAGSHYREATRLGLQGDDQADALYKQAMFEKAHGSQQSARDALTKCLEVGSDSQKESCERELHSLGGFK
jgi:tetratricopeptide (TPR) repeat protein